MSTSILVTIQSQIIYYGYPIFMTLGNIGNIFVMILFSRQRQNACSIYLLSSAIMNELYLNFNGFVQLFPFYYGDETIRAFALCKMRYYVSNVFGQLAKTMVILACIDRFMITNDRATFRALSTPKRAKLFILISIIFWPLFASHIAIMTTIINKQCGAFGTYSTIYTIYSIIFVGLMPPLILGIFGYLAYHNMKQIHARVQPMLNNPNHANIVVRRRDRELLVIVIAEVFVYVVSTTFYPLILLEMMISRYILPMKPAQYLQIENFIFTIAFLIVFINNAAPFYIYLISSKSFRRDFKELIISCYRKLRNQPPVAAGRNKNSTVIRRDTHV